MMAFVLLSGVNHSYLGFVKDFHFLYAFFDCTLYISTIGIQIQLISRLIHVALMRLSPLALTTTSGRRPRPPARRKDGRMELPFSEFPLSPRELLPWLISSTKCKLPLFHFRRLLRFRAAAAAAAAGPRF